MEQLNEVARQTDSRTGEHTRTESRTPMSYADFLTHLEDSTHAEWVNGEAIIFMPPTTRHQRVVNYLYMLIGLYLQVFQQGELFEAPYAMRIEATGSVREPDLLFVAQDHVDRIGEQRLNGPADLVIEIISAESVGRDRSEKFYEYQAGGVREYWIIDPRPGLARADFWVLDNHGVYQPIPIQPDGTYHSTVLPEFKLDVNGLLADELPSPLKALANMVGVETLMRALGNKK